MRLLYILPEYGTEARGGIATFYAQLLPALVQAGCHVDVCLAAEGSNEAVPGNVNGINVRSVSNRDVLRAGEGLHHFSSCPGVRHALAVACAAWETSGRGEGYDVVETTDFGLLFIPWLTTAQGPPVVVQLHGSSGQVDYHDPAPGNHLAGLLTRLLEAAFLGRAEELQAYSSLNSKEWQQLLRRDVQLIYPAFSEGSEPNAEAQLDLEASQAGLAVGRIQEWKGPHTLCEAAGLLGGESPKILWIGRDNPYREQPSMAAHLRDTFPGVWGTRVIPIGERPRDVVRAIQRAAAFVVVPSEWDTMNLAAVEGLSSGKVVICSRGAGASELIDHGVSGFTFPAGDAAALAKLLARVAVMTKAERNLIGMRARDAVERYLSPDRVVPRRLERYRLVKARGIVRESSLWTEKMFAASAVGPDFAFLEQVPARAMARQVIRRTMGKSRQVLK